MRPNRAGAVVAGLLAALVLAVALPVVLAGPAAAHAVLVDSEPSDGATLQVAPAQLRLRLSETVVPKSTRVILTDGSGRSVALPGTHVGDTVAPGGDPQLIYRPGDPGAPTTITVDLPRLAPDVYRIAWSTLSAADLHSTSGVVVFGVQRGATAAGNTADDALPPAAEVALRWLMLLGAALAAGALALARLAHRLALAGTDRLPRVGAWAAGGSAAAAALLLVVQASLDGISVGDVLASSSYGWRWGAREVAALLLAACCVVARRGVRRWTTPAGSLALIGFAAASASLGHAGAAGSTAAGLAVRFVADSAHIGAALLWAGLLACLTLLSLDAQVRARWRPLLLATGRIAAVSVAVLAVSGVLLAGFQVASVDALLMSTYGRLLLGKLGVAALGGLAALCVVRVLRSPHRALRGGPRPALRHAVVAESAALLVVLGLAAALASSRPASGPEWAPASGAVPIRSGQVRDLVETVTVSPNRPGRNFLTVDVYQTRRPAPGEIRQVSAVLSRPGSVPVTVPLRPDTAGRWLAPTDAFVGPGGWQVDVVVQRDVAGRDTASYPWLVADPQARLKAAVLPPLSSAPLESVTPWLALALAVAAGACTVFGKVFGKAPGWVLVEDGDQVGPTPREDFAWPSATPQTSGSTRSARGRG